MFTNSSSAILKLKEILPESCWSWVFPALREDRLIWESFNSLEDIYHTKDLANVIGKPEDCSPALLTLKALSFPKDISYLRNQPIQIIEEKFFKENKYNPNVVVNDLAQAGLQALKLRQLWASSESWHKIGKSLCEAAPTSLACLYGMIPDPQDMLHELISYCQAEGFSSQKIKPIFEKIIHIVLSNPASFETQVKIIDNLIAELPFPQRREFIEIVFIKHPPFLNQLSQYLEIPDSVNLNQNPITIDEILPYLNNLYSSSKALHITKQSQEETSLLNKSINLAQKLEAKIASQLAILKTHQNDFKESAAAWERAIQMDQEASYVIPLYLFTLIESNQVEEAKRVLYHYNNINNPINICLLKLIHGIIDACEDLDKNQRIRDRDELTQVIDEVFKTLEIEYRTESIDFDPYNLLIKATIAYKIMEWLRNLRFWKQSNQAAQFLCNLFSKNPKILTLQAQCQQLAGKHFEATNALQLASALLPGNPAIRRFLAESLMTTQEWSLAMEQWQRLIYEQGTPLITDIYGFCASAIKSGHFDECIRICQQHLKEDEQDGIIYALLGTAINLSGEQQEAASYLKKSIQLSPDQPFVWLAMASFLKSNHQVAEMLETLQTADLTSPSHPEIHLALGDALTEQKTTTQALAEYRTAADLTVRLNDDKKVFTFQSMIDWTDDDSNKIFQEYCIRKNLDWLSPYITTNQLFIQAKNKLGEALIETGHLQEAKQVLEEAYLEFPDNRELAYAYGHTLMKLKDFHNAILPLSISTQEELPNPEPYLDHARCLIELIHQQGNGNKQSLQIHKIGGNLSLDNQISYAISLLHKTLELNPNHPEAKVLLAELLIQRNDNENALSLLNEAAESELSEHDHWKNRLALDISQAASRLQRNDLALASLLEADQTNPQILMSLANTYQSMDLTENAYKVARESLSLNKDDIDQILWFSRFIQKNKSDNQSLSNDAQVEAIAALQRGIEIAPQRAALYINLGSHQIQTQQTEAARDTFKKLVPNNQRPFILEATSSDLYTAGKNLLDLQEPDAAAACLECALQQNYTPLINLSQAEAPSLLNILNELAQAYRKSGHLEMARQAFEQALTINPHDVPLHLAKVNIQLELNSNAKTKVTNLEQEIPALECLEKALNENPDHPQILLNLALLNRAIGNTARALTFAKRLIQILEDNSEISQTANPEKDSQQVSSNAARVLASDIAYSVLREQEGDRYLEKAISNTPKLFDPSEESNTTRSLSYPSDVDFITQKVQHFLNIGNHQGAAEQLIPLDITSNDPRVMAVQARLYYRLGDASAAMNLLNSAWQTAEEIYFSTDINSTHPKSLSALATCYGLQHAYQLLAIAAYEQFQWDLAQKCLEKIPKLSPQEPKPYLDLVIFTIHRAEYQNLFDELNVIKRSPGKSALEDKAHQQFLSVITRLKRLLQNTSQVQDSDTSLVVTRWEIRGKAIFEPNQKIANELSENIAQADDLAALLSCKRSIGESDDSILEKFNNLRNTSVYIQKALNLTSENPEQALSTIVSAIDNLHQVQIQNPEQAINFYNPPEINLIPLLLAFQAKIQSQLGGPSGKIKEALSSIEKAIDYWPDEPEWHALAASIYQNSISPHEQVDYSNAIHHLEQSCTLDPRNWRHYLSLSKIFLDSKQANLALQTLKQALEISPENSQVLLMLAEANLAQGHRREANDCLDHLLSNDPRNPDALIMQADLAFENNDFEKTIKHAKGVLELDSDNPKGMLLLSRAMAAKGNIIEAQSVLENIPQRSNLTVPLYVERIKLIRQEKGIQAAIEELNNLIERFPNHPLPLAFLAELNEENGNSEEALQLAQRALQIGHNLPIDQEFTEHAALHNQIGRIMHKSGQLDHAVQHLTEAIKIAPTNVEPYLELGKVHMDRRQHQEALDVYETVIKAAPDSSKAFYHAGIIYKECKDYENAERMFRQAAKLAPNDLSIQRQLGAVVALNLVHNRKQ